MSHKEVHDCIFHMSFALYSNRGNDPQPASSPWETLCRLRKLHVEHHAAFDIPQE